MNTKHKYLLLVLIFLWLSACSRDKTIKYFLLHPKEMQATYDKCVYLNGTFTARQTQECIAVLQAIPIFRLYLAEFVHTPSKFGVSILQAEMKLAQFKKAYPLAIKQAHNQAQISHLTQAIAIQELEIQSRFAIIRFAAT